MAARGRRKPTFVMHHAARSCCIGTSLTPCMNFGHRCTVRVLGTRPRFVVLLYCLSEYPGTFKLRTGRLKVVVAINIVVLSRSRIKLLSLIRCQGLKLLAFWRTALASCLNWQSSFEVPSRCFRFCFEHKCDNAWFCFCVLGASWRVHSSE